MLAVGGEITNYLIARQVANDLDIIFDFGDYKEDMTNHLATNFIRNLLPNANKHNTFKLVELYNSIQHSKTRPPRGNILSNPLD